MMTSMSIFYQLENDEFEGYPEITYDRKAINHMERTSLIKPDKNIIKETSLLAFPIIIQGLVYELQSLTDRLF